MLIDIFKNTTNTNQRSGYYKIVIESRKVQAGEIHGKVTLHLVARFHFQTFKHECSFLSCIIL